MITFRNCLVLVVLYSPVLLAPLFETQCQYVEAKLTHFLSWSRDQSEEDVGPFIDYPFSDYWAYADYKYIVNLFQDQPSMFEVIKHGNLVCTCIWIILKVLDKVDVRTPCSSFTPTLIYIEDKMV